MKNKSNVNINFDSFGLLTIAFIVLKLCKVIDWSWWWVLAPTWIPLTLFVVIICVIVVIKKIRRYRL